MQSERLKEDVESLKSQVAELVAERRSRAARLRALGVVAVGAGLVATVASAADGLCSNSLPFCFTADTPALAVQVNHNFDQVVEWMELKTGPVGTNTLTTNTVRADAGTFTTLGVANGLPITIEPEIFRTLSNDDTQRNEPIAVANNRRVCFLTGMQVHDTFGNDSEARCHVEIAGNPDGGVGTWMIRYDVDNGALSGFAGPDVECAARCISW